MLIFKPIYYSRKNINGDYIDQIMAGMCSIKKDIHKIINPEIFVDMFEYIDKNYKYNINEYKTPFHFGFEENALSNILLPYFITNNMNINIVPIYFDFGHSFCFYYESILSCLTQEYKNIIETNLGLSNNNICQICYVTPLYGFNIHIGIILTGFLEKCLTNNKINMIIPDKINELKKILSIKGFYHIYPSFNIMLPIDIINYYIDELYNGNTISIKPTLLPIDAKYEFNEDTHLFYDKFIDENQTLNNFLDGQLCTLNILSSSNL